MFEKTIEQRSRIDHPETLVHKTEYEHKQSYNNKNTTQKTTKMSNSAPPKKPWTKRFFLWCVDISIRF